MAPNNSASGKIQVKLLRRRRLLAFALVVFGQLNLLAHLHEVTDTHSSECLVCTQLHTQGHGLIPASPVVPALIPECFPAVLRIADAATSPADSPKARAPPSRSLA